MKKKQELLDPTKPTIMTLANKISVCRVLLIPVIVILLMKRMDAWAFILILVSIITDLLDGLAARLMKEQTQLGAFLDPLADKLLTTSVYLTLTYLNVIEIWIFVVIFSRDLLIVLGWGIIHILTGSSKITPRILGKTTTAVQMVAALVFVSPMAKRFEPYLIWGIVLLTVASVVDYVLVGEKRLGQWG